MKLPKLSIFFFLFPAICFSQKKLVVWEFSPPKSYHNSLVKVESNGSVTSGVYIHFGKLQGILTCKHGLEGSEAKVYWSDGNFSTV